MLLTMTLAVRNLGRNLRRTLITLAAIAFGLMTIHFTITLQNGSYEEMLSQGVSTLAGHVVVQAPGYQEDKDPDRLVEDADDVGTTLAEAFPDATIATRLRLGGLLTSPTSSVAGALNGVEPAAEAAVQSLDDKLVEGTWLDVEDDRGILVGEAMAETLSVTLGDKVVFMGQFGDSDDVQSRLFRVKGIFRTGTAEMDGFLALANLSAARELFGGRDVAHQVTVHLEDPRRAFEATDEARALFPGESLDVRSWREAIPELWGLIEVDRQSGDVMLVILGLIVTMGVLNTVLMSALERTREFGVMMALGLKPARLATLILAEGLALGVFGALLGLIAGVAASWPLVVYGIDYSSMLGSEAFETGGIAISTMLHGKFAFDRMAAFSVGAVVFTTLAAVYPAVHVARLEPVAAMRHV